MLSRSCALRTVVLLCFICAAIGSASQDGQPAAAPKVTFTDNRIAVDVPVQPLRLAEENEITVHIRDGELEKLWTMQAQYRDAAHTVADAVGAGEQETPVLRRADGSQFIRVVPMALGEVQLGLIAQFRGGALDQSAVTLKVGPSSKPPAWIAIAPAGLPRTDTDYLRVNTDDPYTTRNGGRERIFFEAYYYGLKESITLDPSFMRFRVIQPSPPVINLDSNGSIKPLRRGDALLELSYGGAVRRTCVLIRRQRDGFDRGTCKQLRLSLLKSAPQPLSTTWLNDPDGLYNDRFWAGTEFYTDRLNVTPPDHPVEFGQPVTVPVEITSGKLQSLGFVQRRSDMDDPNLQPNQLVGGHGVLTVGEIRMKTGEEAVPKFLEIVPMTVGDETVQVVARFHDDGFATRYFRMRVLPSTKGLRRLDVLDHITTRGRQLRPYLHYEQLGAQVDLPTLSGFKIAVEQPETAPIVRIDPDGLVHEIRPGVVMVTVSLGAISGRYRLQVSPPLNRVRPGFSQ